MEDDIDITGENYEGNLVDFTIEDNCYVNDKFIGTTVAKKIIVNILNPDNEINLENKEIQPFVGINDEYVPFGNFIIEKPENEEVKEKTKFVGYDYMIKFNIPYENRVTYPIQLNVFLQDLCSQAGLQLGNVNFPNADFIITENSFINNEDCRTVLSDIAQLAGGFAKIGRDNKVYIVSLKNTTKLTVEEIDEMTVETLNNTLIGSFVGQETTPQESLDGNNYFTDFSKNKKWGELNSLTLTTSNIDGESTSITDDDSIEENGLTDITITDNYFLFNETKRRSAIMSLWNELNGIEYLPFRTNYYGYPYLDSGDMIYIQDSKDTTYTSFVFNHTFTYNGSFKGSIDTPALTKTQTAYKNISDIKTNIKRAERNIDKINGTIEDIIEQTYENTSRISRHTQTINKITDEVSEKVGEEEIIAKLNLAIQDGQGTINITGNQVTIDSDNFELSADGKVICKGIKISDGILYLEDEGKEGDIVAMKIHSTLGDDDDPDAPDETESRMELYSDGMSFTNEDMDVEGAYGLINFGVDPGSASFTMIGAGGGIDADVDLDGARISINGEKVLTNNQKVLWNGALFMNAGQAATLSENVTDQNNGIVLIWSDYTNNQANNWHWNCQFIPKKQVELFPGCGITCIMSGGAFSLIGAKYVYISDDKITGNSNNGSAGSANGISYANNRFVLRYVIGV